MGMALIGPEGDCHFNITAWSMLLDLAVQYGWKPAGVLEPKPQEEDEPPAVEVTACEELPADSPLAGAISSMFPSEEEEPNLTRYFFNCGYRVQADDARALGEALEQALPDVPDHDALEHKTFRHPSDPSVRLIDVNTPVNPFEWFSGKKDLLRDFIAFCRQGGFEIW